MTAACFHAVAGYLRHMSYSLLLSESSPGDLSLDAACSQLNQRLSSGDPDSWNEVFDLLYPVAFQSARVILSGKFGSECEDVAMETLAEILNQAVSVASAQGLKPLAAAIARNKSKDLLRRRLAEKRGGNKIESLDLMIESSGERAVALPQADFLDALTTGELRELLTELSEELKKEYRLILKDHFFDLLSHSEIAAKRKIAVGSVGKYLQRGISCMRDIVARKPKLQNELREVLTDIGAVDVLLPLVTAVQLKPYKPDEEGMCPLELLNEEELTRALSEASSTIKYSLVPLSEEERKKQMAKWSDEEILRSTPDELPEARGMEAHQRARMFSELKAKFPVAVEAWTLRKNQEADLEASHQRRRRRHEALVAFVTLLVLAALIGALIFGISRLISYLL
jgi:RNA polymerase sigma factor (sigma-70 family)